MKQLVSIRSRISHLVLWMAGACGLALILAVGTLLHRAVDRLLDDGLHESAEILYGLLAVNGSRLDAANGQLPAPPHEEGVVWQLIDGQGRLVLRSHQAPDHVLSERHERGFSDHHRWRVYAMPLASGEGVLYVAQHEEHRFEIRWQILGSIMGVTALVGVVLVVWLNRRLRSELRPLQDLSDAVGRYDPLADPHELPRPARKELVPMVRAISDLGERLAKHVAHERAFAAHAAHALRTPLAGMDAQLAVAIRESDPAVQGRLIQTREAATRLRNVVTALISLFRAGGEMSWQDVSLPRLVGNLPVRGVAVTVTAPPVIEADPDLLSAALLNVLDNAARHQATQVSVEAVVDSDWTRITVRDNGEGISLERLQQVEAALASNTPAEGLGLGLTMTQLVAKAHGGSVQLRRRTDASGVEVLLVLHRRRLATQGPGDEQP